jgi:hypothetical protein
MIKKMFFICWFSIVLAGCSDYSGELKEMKSLLDIKQAQIEEYRKLGTEVEEMKKRVQTICLASSTVLDRLDRLDQSLYQGRYVAPLREKKAGTDDIVAGYIALIDRAEKDLAESKKQ